MDEGYELYFSKGIDDRPRYRHRDRYIIIFNIAGPFQVVINNHHIHIEKDSIILLGEDDNLHLISSPEADFSRYELYIMKSYVDDLSTSATDLSECFRYKDFVDVNVISLSEADAAQIRDQLDRLQRLSDFGDHYGSSFSKRLLISYILLIANMKFRQAYGLSQDDLPLPGNSRFYQIVTYIRDNYWEDITIDGLSLKFGISRNDLCGLFRRSTGRTPIQYLIEYRISKAMEFLKDAVSAEGVCNKVGFNNYPHFSRTFKKRVGMSPKQYQNMVRNLH